MVTIISRETLKLSTGVFVQHRLRTHARLYTCLQDITVFSIVIMVTNGKHMLASNSHRPHANDWKTEILSLQCKLIYLSYYGVVNKLRFSFRLHKLTRPTSTINLLNFPQENAHCGFSGLPAGASTVILSGTTSWAGIATLSTTHCISM